LEKNQYRMQANLHPKEAKLLGKVAVPL